MRICVGPSFSSSTGKARPLEWRAQRIDVCVDPRFNSVNLIALGTEAFVVFGHVYATLRLIPVLGKQKSIPNFEVLVGRAREMSSG